MEGRIDWCTEKTGSKDTNSGGCFLKCRFEVLMLKLEGSGKNRNFDALLNHEGLQSTFWCYCYVNIPRYLNKRKTM